MRDKKSVKDKKIDLRKCLRKMESKVGIKYDRKNGS